jgi:hypothetical protein
MQVNIFKPLRTFRLCLDHTLKTKEESHNYLLTRVYNAHLVMDYYNLSLWIGFVYQNFLLYQHNSYPPLIQLPES